MEAEEIDNRTIDELTTYSLNKETYVHERAIEICQLIANMRKFYENNAITNTGTSFEFALWYNEAEKLYDFFDEAFPECPRIEPMNEKTVFELTHELRRLYEKTINGMR